VTVNGTSALRYGDWTFAPTKMPPGWIAERLGMGSRGYLTWLLYRQGKVR
jgi:hypothetical protein